MALTDSQKADVRYYAGWSARFHQTDSGLEHAMLALASDAAHEAQVVALITEMKAIDQELTAARGRYKADSVGSIELNRSEPQQIRRDGKIKVRRMCSILGIQPGVDVFGLGGGGGSNFIGK